VRTGLRGRGLTALPPHTAPKEIDADRFAVEVAHALRVGRERGEYDFLALVAPPRFLGLVRDKLDTQVRRRLVACVDKELTLAQPRELSPHLSDVFDAVERAELAAPNER
jgi:protein required for attachment to host cells